MSFSFFFLNCFFLFVFSYGSYVPTKQRVQFCACKNVLDEYKYRFTTFLLKNEYSIPKERKKKKDNMLSSFLFILYCFILERKWIVSWFFLFFFQILRLSFLFLLFYRMMSSLTSMLNVPLHSFLSSSYLHFLLFLYSYQCCFFLKKREKKKRKYDVRCLCLMPVVERRRTRLRALIELSSFFFFSPLYFNPFKWI